MTFADYFSNGSRGSRTVHFKKENLVFTLPELIDYIFWPSLTFFLGFSFSDSFSHENNKMKTLFSFFFS